jgi:hypothetical protein
MVIKKFANWRTDGGAASKCGRHFLSCGFICFELSTTTLLQKAFGHHHNRREKIVHTQESTGERRGT